MPSNHPHDDQIAQGRRGTPDPHRHILTGMGLASEEPPPRGDDGRQERQQQDSSAMPSPIAKPRARARVSNCPFGMGCTLSLGGQPVVDMRGKPSSQNSRLMVAPTDTPPRNQAWPDDRSPQVSHQPQQGRGDVGGTMGRARGEDGSRGGEDPSARRESAWCAPGSLASQPHDAREVTMVCMSMGHLTRCHFCRKVAASPSGLISTMEAEWSIR